MDKQAVDMNPSDILERHRVSIREIVAAHQAYNPRVFGSVLTGNDTDESDIDIIVEPTPEATLLDIGAIQYKLERLMGIRVDVLTPRALPASFRQQIIAEALPI